MDLKILNQLEHNAKLTTEEIAVFTGEDGGAVAEAIARLENEGVIRGYHTLINWEKTDKEYITAIIEIKVTPARGQGFDRIAERIYRFDEVKALYLMSGGYDLSIIVEGKSIKDISYFVTDKLAPLESVLSTATHFVLKKYKERGEIMTGNKPDDERMIVSP
ncbi:MAG: Lrp/AsnC family transcriptional regulator [Defluviitaleaceae bacterium]|nr:Lrp/AsnC family transcriptional regulator [Defluviitaleaceae bacterium]